MCRVNTAATEHQWELLESTGFIFFIHAALQRVPCTSRLRDMFLRQTPRGASLPSVTADVGFHTPKGSHLPK